MNIRLKKEFQALFWPWLVATLIGLVPILSWMLPASQFDQSFHGVYMLACVGFVLGTALLATLPFGEEFSLRTMSILLSHPVTRWQIWTEKLKITLILTITIALLNAVSCLPFWGMMESQLKLALAFLVFTVSSGAFWVLLARSTIGGTVLCLFTQAVVVVTAYVFTQARYFDIGIWDTRQDTEGILLKISLLVSPVFLWFGWKLFSRLQDTGIASFEIPLLTASNDSKATSKSLLRARSDSPRLNLLCKELSHYRPLLLMAYLFSALWIGMLLLNSFFPLKHNLLADTLNGFMAIYAALVLVTSGCISLGEEKELGIHACNLALPVAWKRQWLLKISLACLIGLGCAILLPLFLAKFETIVAIQPMKTWAWRILHDLPILWTLCLLLASFVTVSFWAATVTNRTIHAAFLAGFIIMLVAVFHTMGKSMKQGPGYHTAALLDWITAHLHLHLGWSYHYFGYFFLLSFAVIGLFFIPLSLMHYQNQSASKAHTAKAIVMILTVSWLSGITLADLRQSTSDQHSKSSSFNTELLAALHEVKADIWHTNLPPNFNYRCDAGYLDRAGKLSPLTRTWLEGFLVRVNQRSYTNMEGQTFHYIEANLERQAESRHLFHKSVTLTNATEKLQAIKKN